MPVRRALFVTTDKSTMAGGGGVQVCTRDYLALLQTAGFDLSVFSFSLEQGIGERISAQVKGLPRWRRRPRDLPERILRAAIDSSAEIVFFNLLDFPDVAAKARRELGNRIKLIHLSHGLDSTDMSIDDQASRHRHGTIAPDMTGARTLGSKLQFEADYRRYLDASLCLAPLDAELERWLGVPNTAWFSRPVHESPLTWKPADRRVGCVSTLDHPPNRIGLTTLFEELAKRDSPNLDFRLIGGPEGQGLVFARQYSFVSYLGHLSDEELRNEASSWRAFVHPLFSYARGCSTKIAVALGWGLPIATTTAGTRGYIWDDSVLPRASNSAQLVDLVLEHSNAEDIDAFRKQAKAIMDMQPSAASLAMQMRHFLDSVAARAG
jgi:hypothetical protein